MKTQGQSVPAVLQEPFNQPIERVLRKVWDRMNVRNEHFVGVLVGREGGGKSLTAIKIATLLDDEFTHDQVIFRAENFLKLLRDDEYRSGAVFVLDEAGVMFGNRSWQDRTQVLANQALQLIRSHNVGLIFTLPRLGELDSQTQGRLQAMFEIREKVDGEYVEGPWKWIDPDRSGTTGKIYKKYPRTEKGNRVTSVRFSPPPSSITEQYEERKETFQEEVYDEVIEELNDDDEDDEMSVVEIVDDIIDSDADKYIREINNGTQQTLDKDLIATDYSIGVTKAKRVKKLLDREIDRDVM